MKTIEERAFEKYPSDTVSAVDYWTLQRECYIAGAEEQRKIDIERGKDWVTNQFPDTETYEGIPIEEDFEKYMEANIL